MDIIILLAGGVIAACIGFLWFYAGAYPFMPRRRTPTPSPGGRNTEADCPACGTLYVWDTSTDPHCPKCGGTVRVSSALRQEPLYPPEAHVAPEPDPPPPPPQPERKVKWKGDE